MSDLERLGPIKEKHGRQRLGLALSSLIVLACTLGAMADSKTDPQPQDAVLSLDRMGAGVPGGWHISGDDYAWEPSPEPGPLGMGAARIRLGGSGRLTLASPACLMRAGKHHVAAVWLRSEPPGARVTLAVHDSDSEVAVLEASGIEATDTWQCRIVQGPLPKATKDRYYLQLSATGNECTLWLDGLWLGEAPSPVDADWRPTLHPCAVGLTPEAAWGLVVGQEPMRVRARVAGVTAPGCSLHLKGVHTNGRSEDLPAVALDARGVWEGAVEIGGDLAAPFGMLRIEATVFGANKDPLSAPSETLLARAPEPVPSPQPDSPFGVHVALREPDVACVAKLGYKWVRLHDAYTGTKWGFIEPEPGQWVWHDDDIALARRHGLRVLGLLDTAPPWASGATESGYTRVYHPPKDIAQWRNYVRRVVDHYAGAIDDWEVWNEPWLYNTFFRGGSPQAYAELLKTAYEEAKAANPACTVVGVNTYPAIWDRMVLFLGAYGYYDELSFHRYEPGLEGRPDDAFARVADRLRAEQAKYGPPKPLNYSEGGPDRTVFHGSFFSFADPAIMGDWSWSADQYPRMHLGVLAAGVKRFFLYSLHHDIRHGKSTWLILEPGPLLRPMHLSFAALAHFLEGARFDRRLAPAHDISALVFRQPNARPYAEGASTVVVLYANGEDAEPLPRALPPAVRCFDRWANPAEAPAEATRSPRYLVATGEAEAKLLDALSGAPDASATGQDDVESLLKSTLAALTGQTPLWQCFSTYDALAVAATPAGPVTARRGGLRSDPALAARFLLPAGTHVREHSVVRAQDLLLGQVLLANEDDSVKWAANITAIQDGPAGSWRLLSLSIAPSGETDACAQDTAAEAMGLWEHALAEGDVMALRPHMHPEALSIAFSLPDGEFWTFRNRDHCLLMLEAALTIGQGWKSHMEVSNVRQAGDVLTFTGVWKLAVPLLGTHPLAFTATLLHAAGGWQFVSLCGGFGSG